MAPLRTWPKSERPRERLLDVGAAALSDAELLALILGASAPGAGGVVAVCRDLLHRCNGLSGLGQARPAELTRLRGIGPARACALVAVFELARRVAACPWDRGRPIHTTEDVYARLRPRLADLRYETFFVLALDARHGVISTTQVAQGTARGVEVHPREVFAPAIRDGAAFVIVAHNHPSGDPTPSVLDHELTAHLVQAGMLLGIPLLDHLVVGEKRFVSLIADLP